MLLSSIILALDVHFSIDILEFFFKVHRSPRSCRYNGSLIASSLDMAKEARNSVGYKTLQTGRLSMHHVVLRQRRALGEAFVHAL